MTTAPTVEDEAFGAPVDGQTLYRISPPHIYPVSKARQAPGWQKPLWHLQDLFDPRCLSRLARVIDAFQPDIVHVHWIQGMGYNGLKLFGRYNIPTVITLHDLSLACVRTTMYRGTDECVGACGMCRFSAAVKLRYLRAVPRLGLISPSLANLRKLQAQLPIGDIPSFHVINPNRYPDPVAPHAPSERLRLVYAGRLEATKGVLLLLEAIEPLAQRHAFALTLLGSGPEEQALRDRYGHHPWLTIAGQVPLQRVTDVMAQSDLLLTPSLWLENSPGVVFQALAVALPVMASDRGGLPELVQPGANGFLVPPGNVMAWRNAIEAVLEAPEALVLLRHNAAAMARNFSADQAAGQIMACYKAVIGTPAV